MSDSLEVTVIPGQWAYLNVAVCGDYVKGGGSPGDVEVWAESILPEPTTQPSPTLVVDAIEVAVMIENVHSSPIAVDVYADSSDLDRKVTVYGNSYEIFNLSFAEPGFHFVLFGWTNPLTGQEESHDWIRYDLTDDEFIEVKVPKVIPISPKPSPTPTPTPSPSPTIQPSPTADNDAGEITDGFANVVGDFPMLFSDGSDSTYVRGGILAGDYDAKFTMEVEQVPELKFLTRVKCIAGGCGDEEVCGYRFYARNWQIGEFDRIDGVPWEAPGIHEYELVVGDSDVYSQNGVAEFWFSFHCNMDGYVTEFYQITDDVQPSPIPTKTEEPSPTPTPSPSEVEEVIASGEPSLNEKVHILGLDLKSPDSLFGIAFAGLTEANLSDY